MEMDMTSTWTWNRKAEEKKLRETPGTTRRKRRCLSGRARCAIGRAWHVYQRHTSRQTNSNHTNTATFTPHQHIGPAPVAEICGYEAPRHNRAGVPKKGHKGLPGVGRQRLPCLCGRVVAPQLAENLHTTSEGERGARTFVIGQCVNAHSGGGLGSKGGNR